MTRFTDAGKLFFEEHRHDDPPVFLQPEEHYVVQEELVDEGFILYPAAKEMSTFGHEWVMRRRARPCVRRAASYSTIVPGCRKTSWYSGSSNGLPEASTASMYSGQPSSTSCATLATTPKMRSFARRAPSRCGVGGEGREARGAAQRVVSRLSEREPRRPPPHHTLASSRWFTIIAPAPYSRRP